MAQECIPEFLDDHPATDALVWIVLGQIQPATAAALAEQTRCPERTVTDALRRLCDTGVVERHPHPNDGRKIRYRRSISARDSL